MFIQEAAKRTGTTKKAIEYYCLKGLLNPQPAENGYRDFTEEDIIRLKKISLLRTLGVPVEEIRELLNGNDTAVFQKIIAEQETLLQRRKEQNELLKELAASLDWNAVQRKAAAAESRQSVTERLVRAFPGFWGKYLSLHFGRFLQDPVRTEEQGNALHDVCEYLDSVKFEIPVDLENELDEMDSDTGRMVQHKADEALAEAVNDPEGWLKNNKEIIDRYLEFQKTDEYRSAPVFRLLELLRTFNQDSGYNTVFIPAMRRLSPAYDAYMNRLQEADQAFSRQYLQ
ncbi:MAG: MerR family transcriptional regulator [Solobacterium sp.]|nr:MerR family transcriptional regulator [Solobacterium sp.]